MTKYCRYNLYSLQLAMKILLGIKQLLEENPNLKLSIHS